MNRSAASGARLALDLGTTTLGGMLLDASGATLATAKRPNPQSRFAADVIRRLELAAAGKDRELQQELVQGVNALVADLLHAAHLKLADVGCAAACGNSAICALLLRQPVQRLLFPPHRPDDHLGREIDPVELNLHLSVPLYLFPLVSGYVGGDLVAFVFGMREVRDGTFFLDIGTNGEMAFYHREKWLTTSVAAGPAFEGGEISCGMAATAGAITAVEVVDDRWRLTVVDQVPPRGVSGSGLVSAIGAALESGLLTPEGRIVDPDEVPSNLARYLVESAGRNALRLYRDARCDLLLTQDDIRAFQLARGAIRAGALCLLEKAGVKPEDVAAVIMTGAFGFSLTPGSLKKVAMLPAPMLNKISFEPAGALTGVARSLDEKNPSAIATLAGRLRPLPLSGTPGFESRFLDNLDIR